MLSILRINGLDVGTMTRNTIAKHLKNDTLPVSITVVSPIMASALSSDGSYKVYATPENSIVLAEN